MLDNFEELPEIHRERLINAGIELMAGITDAYGSEVGLQSWDRLSDEFGKGFKHSIFMAMLTGRTSQQLTVRGHKGFRGGPQGNIYIEFIKIIRAISGFGLKEAKDFCDEIDLGVDKAIKLLPGEKRHDVINRLRSIGINAY